MSEPRTGAATESVIDALDAATRAIASLLPVDDVLQVIADEVRSLVRAQYAALGIVDTTGGIERFITSGIDAETRAAIGPTPQGHGLLGLIIREGRSLRIPDVNVHPDRYGFPPHHPPMTSLLGVPISLKGLAIGDFYLTNKLDAAEFTDDDLAIVEAFAGHAAIAIENARLHEQVQRLAVIDERQRISKDLHDGIIQSIYAVGLSLEDVPELMDEDQGEVVRRVERAIDSLHLTIADIRNFIFGLRPELLGGTTLVGGLAAIVEEFRHNTMVDVEFEAADIDDEPSPETTAQLLVIVNEVLSNVARHAGASQAWIGVSADGTSVVVSVGDNGRGFVVGAGPSLGHQGLANIRSRAADIDATLDISSEIGVGTTVRLVVPTAQPQGSTQR